MVKRYCKRASDMKVVLVNGRPGSGKTFALQKMVRASRSMGWKCISVGPLGSDSFLQTKDWPIVRNRVWSVRAAATVSSDFRVAVLGDMLNGKSGNMVGFEAPGAFRSAASRSVLLPYVIRALCNAGVNLLISEALLIPPRSIGEIKRLVSDSARVVVEVNTDPELARKRFVKRQAKHAQPALDRGLAAYNRRGLVDFGTGLSMSSQEVVRYLSRRLISP